MIASELQRGPFVRELLGRSDYRIISELVEENSRVLDLGCGDGALLAWLVETKGVDARGVEIDGAKVRLAIARGVSAYQGDIDKGLADYPDRAFDYVILGQTLQETRRPLRVLREMLRVGDHAIVAFPNFGHWRVRLNHLCRGQAPKSNLFPHNWFDSPNIHVLSVKDFEELVTAENWLVEKKICLAGRHTIAVLHNLFAEVAVFLIKAR